MGGGWGRGEEGGGGGRRERRGGRKGGRGWGEESNGGGRGNGGVCFYHFGKSELGSSTPLAAFFFGLSKEGLPGEGIWEVGGECLSLVVCLRVDGERGGVCGLFGYLSSVTKLTEGLTLLLLTGGSC